MFLCVLGEFGLGKRKFVMNENMFILIEYWVLFWLVDVGLMLLVWFGFLFFLYVNLLMQFIVLFFLCWELLMDFLNMVLVYLLIVVLNGWLLIFWYYYNWCCVYIWCYIVVFVLCDDELVSSFNVVLQIILEMSCYNLFIVYYD